jgi:hypothetical protein
LGERARQGEKPDLSGVVMAESKPVPSYPNRRLQRRYPLAVDVPSSLRFRHPERGGQLVEVAIRDISLSGVSLVLPFEILGLQIGDIVRGVEGHVQGRRFHGDLLVMHMTPANELGGVCGGLFYPEGDEDLITIRLVVRMLDNGA